MSGECQSNEDNSSSAASVSLGDSEAEVDLGAGSAHAGEIEDESGKDGTSDGAAEQSGADGSIAGQENLPSRGANMELMLQSVVARKPEADAREGEVCHPGPYVQGSALEVMGRCISLQPPSLAIFNQRPRPAGTIAATSSQYRHVALTILSIEKRLLSSGVVQPRTGYDGTDPWLDDQREELPRIGAPVYLVGRSCSAAYLGRTSGSLHRVRPIGEPTVLHVSRACFLLLPTRPPTTGDWVLGVDLSGEEAQFNGACGHCGAPDTSGVHEDLHFWITFQHSSHVSMPELVLLPSSNLVALPENGASFAAGALAPPLDTSVASLVLPGALQDERKMLSGSDMFCLTNHNFGSINGEANVAHAGTAVIKAGIISFDSELGRVILHSSPTTAVSDAFAAVRMDDCEPGVRTVEDAAICAFDEGSSDGDVKRRRLTTKTTGHPMWRKPLHFN